MNRVRGLISNIVIQNTSPFQWFFRLCLADSKTTEVSRLHLEFPAELSPSCHRGWLWHLAWEQKCWLAWLACLYHCTMLFWSLRNLCINGYLTQYWLNKWKYKQGQWMMANLLSFLPGLVNFLKLGIQLGLKSPPIPLQHHNLRRHKVHVSTNGQFHQSLVGP